MIIKPRVVKVLVVLLVSMTFGAAVLIGLGNHPPSAGPFCLYSYYRLGQIEESLDSRAIQSPNRWNRIEIYYSNTKGGNIEQLSSRNGLANPEDLNCHFVVCNGFGGKDGGILATEKWQRQWSAIPDKTWFGMAQTVRICVVADGKSVFSTDSQRKRIEALVEQLFRKFDIEPQFIYYPGNW